jgi:phage-related protein
MVQEKIEYIFRIIRLIDRVQKKFLEYMEGTAGLYEIKITVGTNIYRIFCCFDEGNVVVLFNGFQKKTQKTPRKEIVKAVKLKNEYFELKNQK